MNKVFKVIWNEARNAYVVVSEIAKNHGSKSCSTKKLLAMLIATGVMTCASFDVLAAQPVAATTAAQQYVALKAKEFDRKPLAISPDRAEWDAQQKGKKQIGGYTYKYDATNKYWVREDYVLTVDKNGGKYTPLSDNAIRADVAYTGTGVPEGILQSVTSTVSANGTVTNMGESLNKVTAGSFAGVSHSGGTEVAGSWDYIIKDASWEGNKDGYVNLNAGATATAPKGFVNTDSNDLNWDDSRQAYFYKNQRVDYSNMYVINGKLGVFTNAGGTNVYTGTVYGSHNEILMTVKDGDKFYSYWASEVTDPSATMATYRVEEYNKNLAKLVENDDALYRNDIKEVTMTTDGDGATIGLLRNGDSEAGTPVKGAIKVTSGGGTEGNDTFVKISNTADTVEKTFATGSKVEVKEATAGAGITGIKVNGQDYTIKSGSKVSVAQNAAKKTTTITVDGKDTIITDTDTHNKLDSAKLNGKTLTITGKDGDTASVDLSSIDTDTKYTTGNGIAIDEDNKNAISVKLKKDENNLEVTADGLALKKDLNVDSVKAGTSFMSAAGIGYGDKAYITSSGLNANGQTITNVKAGEADTDAVNVSQLNKLSATAKTEVKAGANTSVVKETGANGQDIYTVNAKDTTYSAGDNVAIDNNNKISVDLSQYAKTEDVAVVYDKNKTSLRSTNAKLQTSSKEDEAVDSIAFGNGASAVKESVAIGNGASVVEGSNGLGGVALGNKAHAGYKGTSLGSNAISGREGTTIVGANTNSGSLYTTVVGTDSVISSDGTEYKILDKKINVQGAMATAYGAYNKVVNNNKKVFSGVSNSVIGSVNTVNNSNGVTIQGTGNTVTDAYKDMNITYGDLKNFKKGDYSSLGKKQSGAVAVVGGANTVSKQTDSTVIGYDNKLIGGTEKGSQNVFMAGSHNRLNNVSDSIVMGNDNTISEKSNVISFGHKNAITANNAVAIGNGAGVSVEGGVALGVGSVASTAAGEVGYGAAENDETATWKATHGAVSVGGNGATRQITNVAAGTADTDAVNVAQLKKVSETAANAIKGWKLKTKNGNVSNVNPGDEVEFDGDANIQVGNTNNKVSITLKDALTGITSITGAGEGAGSISFADGGKVKVNDVTFEKGGKITGVANGTADNDAVNVSQLNKVSVEAGKHTTLSDGKNTTVKSVTTADGHLEYKVDVNDELKDIKSISNDDKTISLDGTALLLKNGDATLAIAKGAAGMQNGAGASVVLNGTQTVINGGVTFDHTGKITNVKAGEADTDAVNVSQLNAVKETANKGWNLSTNGDEASTKVAPGAKVDFSGDDNIKVSNDGTNVKVELKDELKDIKSISNGDKTISLDGTALLLKNGDATLAIAKGAAGMQNGAGASVVLNGTQTVINGGVTFDHTGKITNVKAGEADTDAVNVGQLKDYVAANDTHIKSGDYVVGEVTDSTGNKSQGVSMDIVNKEGKVTGTVTITDVAKASDVGDVNKFKDTDLKNKDGSHTTVVDAVNNLNNKVGNLQYSKVEKGDIADGDSTTTAIGKLNQKLTDVAATAAKHTTVTQGDNITVTKSDEPNENGGENYNVALNKDIELDSVTTGDTVMNKDGLKVGNDVSLNKDGLKVGEKVSVTEKAVTADKTSISDEGVKVGDKTYISDKGLNANGQKVTNVADGKVEKDSKDAINGGQLHQAKADINNRIDNVANEVVNNSNRINQLGSRVNKVGAGAAALAALHPMDFDPDDKLTFSAGYGNYAGQNAAAIGAYYRPDEKVMFSVGGTVGNGENMVNAGVSFALDRTNHVSNSRTAMAREILDLRAEVNELKALVAKGGLGTIEEDKMKIFPDVAENHWAYEYIGKLAAAGIVEGYPDGNFNGDRMMSRYEFAAMLYRAMQKGAQLDSKIINEFAPEMGRIRVDRISGEDGDRDKIERVRVNAVKGERDHYGNKIAK